MDTKQGRAILRKLGYSQIDDLSKDRLIAIPSDNQQTRLYLELNTQSNTLRVYGVSPELDVSVWSPNVRIAAHLLDDPSHPLPIHEIRSAQQRVIEALTLIEKGYRR